MTTPIISHSARLTDPISDLGGRTVLELACERGDEHIVRGVLDGAASPAADDISACQTHIAHCAEIAARAGHPGVLEALDESGAIDAAAWQRVAKLAAGEAVEWCSARHPALVQSPGLAL